MVNYVLSFCKITGASRIFSRNFYLPLLKPLTPKEALRTYRITGKWLLGAKIQHYIPVLLNHKKKRSPKRHKNFGKKSHEEMDDYTYMQPVFDSENESHKLLLSVLENKSSKGVFVYTVHDKKYNIVLQSELERAILDGDVIDVLVSQQNDKIIVKLKSMKKIPLEIQYFEGSEEEMFCGEGATSPEDEKFHHHGKYTMGLAKIFEDKELLEEKWEEELKRIMRKRRRQAKEGSKDWKEMMKNSIKNLDWNKFEEDAKKVIEEIDEPAAEQDIDMDIEDLETTRNVNETILKQEILHQLPTMKEIPEIIKNMTNATLTEVDNVSGVKVTLPSGKECFVSGQMVHTEDGDVFVPGQTVENEFGLEYSPGITINIDNKPTLISGLIMGEEERDPMFLPTQSTITADGQLTFATTQDERPKPEPEKVAMKKNRKLEKKLAEQRIEEEEDEEPVVIEIIVESSEDEYTSESLSESVNESSIELNSSEIEELDLEAMRLKQEQQRLEIEKLKAILMDDGMDDVIASIEDKRAQLQKKLEELRQLSLHTENSLVSYVTENDTIQIAEKISQIPETINRVSEVLMTITRRAASFRDRNNVNADNINVAHIPVANLTEADAKFNETCSNQLKMLLKTAVVAANDVFKSRSKDQIMALNAISEILVDVLRNDNKTLSELLELMNTTNERNDICNAIFKQLVQNIEETKVSALNSIANKNSPSAYDVIEGVEKMLKKESEIKCEAFVKIAKLDAKITNLLVKNINKNISNVKTENEAVEVLHDSIREATKQLIKDNLVQAFESKNDLTALKEDSVSFAKALGIGKVKEELEQASKINRISDSETLEFIQRVSLIRQLAEKDFSLKSAIERVKKNPERARNDPRIRQLIRESALLIGGGTTLRNSRDIPLNLMKTQNLLAIEDFLVQRSDVELPVMVCRNELQAVIPKEAARGVMDGRVAYALIDESGVTNFKPMHRFSVGNINRENNSSSNSNYLNGGLSSSGVRDESRDGTVGERKYLQAAKSNGSDGSWSSARSQRTMSSGSLYRGYTGPRA